MYVYMYCMYVCIMYVYMYLATKSQDPVTPGQHKLYSEFSP